MPKETITVAAAAEEISEEAPEFKEFLKQHVDDVRKQQHHGYGLLVNTYRILKIMGPDSQTGKKYFRIEDLAHIGRDYPLPKKYRIEFIKRAIKAGLIKEIKLPANLSNKKIDYGEDVNTILAGKRSYGGLLKLSKLRNQHYYTLTDNGRTVYHSIKNILIMMESEYY